MTDISERVEAMLKAFYREPSDARAKAYTEQIITAVRETVGDRLDTNRGKVTPIGQGAQTRAGSGFKA